MLFGQIGFQCPYDGQVQAGFDCVEDMVVHEEGKTEISVRCPKCGTLVRISSQTPILPQNVLEQLAQELSVSMKDGKLNFADLLSQVTGGSRQFSFEVEEEDCGDCQNLEDMLDRELTPSEDNQVEYFVRELEKIESVDDFLLRVNEETR
jgi:DNA-directed RNA polymerase subunit M/transcription elongation factor TFIIS